MSHCTRSDTCTCWTVCPGAPKNLGALFDRLMREANAAKQALEVVREFLISPKYDESEAQMITRCDQGLLPGLVEKWREHETRISAAADEASAAIVSVFTQEDEKTKRDRDMVWGRIRPVPRR